MKPKKTPGPAKPAAAEPAIPYRPLASFADLEAACDEPVNAEFAIHRKPVRIEGRRLAPHQVRRLRALLELALPKELPPEAGSDEVRYDFRDPAYRETKEANRRQARALALYWGYPIFRQTEDEAKPPGEAEILARIEHSRLDDGVLEYLFELVTRGIVETVDLPRVGFTSGSSSPAN